MPTKEERTRRILECLAPLPPPEAMAAADDTPNPYVNLSEFKDLCFHGIPDIPGVRETSWKLLLGLLPSDKRKWETTLTTSRMRYLGFVRDFLSKDPTFEGSDPDDEARLLQIRRDVRRTLPELGVLHRAVPDSPYSPLTSAARRENILNLGAAPPGSKEHALRNAWIAHEEVEDEDDEDEGRGINREEDQLYVEFLRKHGQGPISPSATSSSTTITTTSTIAIPTPALHIPPLRNSMDEGFDSSDDELDPSALMGRGQKLRATTLRPPSSTQMAGSFNDVPLPPMPVQGLGPPSLAVPVPEGGAPTLLPPGPLPSLATGTLGVTEVRGGRSRSRSFSDAASASRKGNRTRRPPPLPLALHLPVQPRAIPQPSRSARLLLFERVKHLAPPLPTSAPLRPPSPRRPDLHWEVIERLLYLYARLNPGVGYVQGMNSLLAPIYWLFAQDPDPMGAANAEADAFFCFTALMTDARDHFIPSLDGDVEGGVKASLSRLSRRLWMRDPSLRANLREKALEPHYYAFRWCTCLFTLDWPFQPLLRIWDSLLADPERGEGGGKGFPYLADLCCAMLMAARVELMKGAFEDNLLLLQNYPKDHVEEVMALAEEVRFECAKEEAELEGGSIALPTWGGAVSAMAMGSLLSVKAARRTSSVFSSLTSALTEPGSPTVSERVEGWGSSWRGGGRSRGDSRATIASRAESESGVDGLLRPGLAWGLLGDRWRGRASSSASTPAAFHIPPSRGGGVEGVEGEVGMRSCYSYDLGESGRRYSDEIEEEAEVEVEGRISEEGVMVTAEERAEAEDTIQPEPLSVTVAASLSKWWGGLSSPTTSSDPHMSEEEVKLNRRISVVIPPPKFPSPPPCPEAASRRLSMNKSMAQLGLR